MRVEATALSPALAPDWNRLAGDIPCRRWEWLEPWWRHYAHTEDELFALIVRDQEDRVCAIAPWYIRDSIAQGRVIRFLGSGDVCSDYLTILTDPEHRSAAIAALVGFLLEDAADAWDLIELTGVAAGDQALEEFISLLRQRDVSIHQQPGESCWRLSLPGNWDEYVRTLSKTRRERTRQIVRRHFDSGRAVTRRVTNREELPELYSMLIELHQKRRESLGEQGCFADKRFTSYHREVIERFFELGRLRLQSVLVDGRPAAIEYDLIGGDTIYFYQSGIEPELLDQRPGWMGTIGALRSAIAEGYKTFDFMRGDEAYKASWGAKAVPTMETRIVAPRASSQVRHNAWRAGQQMRRWAKARWKRFRGEQAVTQ